MRIAPIKSEVLEIKIQVVGVELFLTENKV